MISDLFYAAHDEAARRDNPSSFGIRMAAGMGVPFTQALIAGLATLGPLHGPVDAAMAMYCANDVKAAAEAILARGERIPGFGSHFALSEWLPVKQWFKDNEPKLWRRVVIVQDVLENAGKSIPPNPATYTALVAIHLGVKVPSYLFVSARLRAWADIYQEASPWVSGQQQSP